MCLPGSVGANGAGRKASRVPRTHRTGPGSRRNDSLPEPELISEALHRAAVYRVLSAAFAHPSEAHLVELALSGATAASAACGLLRERLARLALAASQTDGPAAAAEHAFLFGSGERCAPRETAYVLGSAPACRADVAGFYETFGPRPVAAHPGLEDHVAAELEFMGTLAIQEACAAADGETDSLAVTRGIARAFLTEHLGCWAEVFATAVRTTTPDPLYAAAAALLATWIDAEIEALGAVPDRAPAPEEAKLA